MNHVLSSSCAKVRNKFERFGRFHRGIPSISFMHSLWIVLKYCVCWSKKKKDFHVYMASAKSTTNFPIASARWAENVNMSTGGVCWQEWETRDRNQLTRNLMQFAETFYITHKFLSPQIEFIGASRCRLDRMSAHQKFVILFNRWFFGWKVHFISCCTCFTPPWCVLCRISCISTENSRRLASVASWIAVGWSLERSRFTAEIREIRTSYSKCF